MSQKAKEITMQAAVIAVLLTLIYIAFTRPAHAAPEIYDSVTGQYLGNLSKNPYDVNSTSNPYGPHGSKYSATSINNPYSKWGSPYSNSSVNNPYATQAPVIRGH
jgi:hypothetical protein